MKKYINKLSIVLLASIIMWCAVPMDVNAEEHGGSPCYPTEKQIQQYKEDGTWERRQEYVKKLNHAATSLQPHDKAINGNNASSEHASDNNIPEVWKGMQVTGDAKILLVRVEFADVTFENSKSYSEEQFYNMVMGNQDTGVFPYESLNAYYMRSSYNKLNIITDKVYSCTLSQNRDVYEWGDTGEQDLIKEVMESLDAAVDFNDYDANKDGVLDGICINFAGENTGWGSTWWSHQYSFNDKSVTFDGVNPAGYIFLETYDPTDSYGTQTLIHETGHLLGLPDYYSQTGEGIGTTDMMNNNRGDHNGFSKWLLGWIEEDNIIKINKASGNTEVTLSPVAIESPGNKKLIAVVAPEKTDVYSEYFVIQYDEYIGNQSVFELEEPAYRIYHVDAELNYEGNNFKYDNVYAYDRYLIKSVSIVEGENGAKQFYYTDGDSMTPDTNESSAFYGGDVMGFTGIKVTDFKTGSSPSFNVSFIEKEVADGKLEFEIVGDTPLNMAEISLLSNKPLINAWSYEQAYLEDHDGKQYPVELLFDDGSYQIDVSYINITDSLKAETEYTLVIPEGMFQIDKDVYSEECRITLKTGVFPELEADYKYEYYSSSGIFNIDDTKAGFLQIPDGFNEEWNAKLHLFKETGKTDVINVDIPIPESYKEIMDIECVTCYDGSIAIRIKSADPVDYSSIFSFYKIDQKGNVLAGPFIMSEELSVFPAGKGIKGTVVNSGALGAPGMEDNLKLEIYTVDFENGITSCLVDINKYMSNVYPLDEKSYVIIENTEQGYVAGIYNNKDKLIKNINMSKYISGNVCAAVKRGKNIAIVTGDYSDGKEYVVSVNVFDMDGVHVGTYEVVKYNEWKSKDGWKIEKTSWGYNLYNSTPNQPYSICFLTEEFELISSMQVPEALSSGTHMGDRCIIKWYDLTTWGTRVAITEPISVQDDPAEDGEAGVKPDKPSDGAVDNAVPETGDDFKLLLMFIVMFISAGVILSLFMKKNTQKSNNIN